MKKEQNLLPCEATGDALLEAIAQRTLSTRHRAAARQLRRARRRQAARRDVAQDGQGRRAAAARRRRRVLGLQRRQIVRLIERRLLRQDGVDGRAAAAARIVAGGRRCVGGHDAAEFLARQMAGRVAERGALLVAGRTVPR